MSQPLDRFKALCVQAGITEQKPLHAVLLILFQTAMMAQDAVRGGARGLSPEGERELVERVAHNAVDVTAQEVERLARRVGWRNSFLMALAGLALVAAGYLWGYWNASPGVFLSSVAATNDVGAMQRFCDAHPVGRDACALPNVVVRGGR